MSVAASYLALGSNLGDRVGYLEAAVSGLRQLDPDLRVSSVYESPPVGGPGDQGPYLNCVVELHTDLSPHELLAEAGRLEAEAGRVRTVRNGPRTLDVDVLLYGDLTLGDDDLVIPHPRMWERPFVLAPLEELDPSLVPTGWRDRLPPELVGGLRVAGTLSPG